MITEGMSKSREATYVNGRRCNMMACPSYPKADRVQLLDSLPGGAGRCATSNGAQCQTVNVATRFIMAAEGIICPLIRLQRLGWREPAMYAPAEEATMGDGHSHPRSNSMSTR